LLLVLGLLVIILGCDEDSTEPEPDTPGPPWPAPTAPESLLVAMQKIYNDRSHSALERFQAYSDLLPNELAPLNEAFIFMLQPSDIQNGLPPSWGRDSELAAHQSVFEAQEAGDIYSLELRIEHSPVQELTPPQVGREGWKEIRATNVYLRLMFDPSSGLEVNGGQAEFQFPPERDGKWCISHWLDLPRPGAEEGRPVENTTWGGVKAYYLPDPR
jgi:hypothetical protein